MKYVIIKKTYVDADISDVDFGSIYSQFPSNYPLEISEGDYNSQSEAELANPGLTVKTLSEYKTFKSILVSENIDLLNQIDIKAEEIFAQAEADIEAN